jgi:preprotein translocase subunit SecD
VGFDPQQRPLVNFRFNPEGGEIFGTLTEENINKPLAIVLDENVYSAPTINSRISTRGQITGRFTSQEAADLAVVLRAGSLSVPVVIEEERSIGPALGQDSIDSGVRASIVGLVLILAFIAGYYRLSGGYASIALLSNLLLLIGLMSLFEATLTLPGIAGLVLTVGMAVDANVIIFERIREELRGDKTPRAAIATGFSKALWTVLDANITTLITAIILLEFGTGPIKGFAVTLSVGIVTSVFSALVITRLLFHLYPGDKRVVALSI